MNDNFKFPDLLVFSHLRWDFVFQRPQHLLCRQARHRRVIYFEEPLFEFAMAPEINVRESKEGVTIVTPYLPKNLLPSSQETALIRLINRFLDEENIEKYSTWYYTPMAIPFTRHLLPKAIIYDCMDELSKFKYAPSEMVEFETELIDQADLVFTGGPSLFEAKRDLHHNIHLFPSSIDYNHFAQARNLVEEPWDQSNIPKVRLGFFGVIDERINLELLAQLAALRPEYQIVMVGPVVKIDPATLPKAANIHYLGKKDYQELPSYLAGWDIALMPFAMNESTQYISPTKTPEYLAAGRPVISTPIRDVVHPYGTKRLVSIANNAKEFALAIDSALQEECNNKDFLKKVDEFLSVGSWDKTHQKMLGLEREFLQRQSRQKIAVGVQRSASPQHREISFSG